MELNYSDLLSCTRLAATVSQPRQTSLDQLVHQDCNDYTGFEPLHCPHCYEAPNVCMLLVW
jgi:hypothetical protein